MNHHIIFLYYLNHVGYKEGKRGKGVCVWCGYYLNHVGYNCTLTAKPLFWLYPKNKMQ